MATFKLNGQSEPTNMLCFSDSINIASIEGIDLSTGYTKAIINIYIDSNITASTDSQWYITILGETITNVTNPINATNKRFLVNTQNSHYSIDTMYASIKRALRCCDEIAVNFDFLEGGGCVLRAKRGGKLTTYYGVVNTSDLVYTNLPESALTITVTDGRQGANYGSIASLSVISGDTELTVLEKNVYKENINFNISPVLGSLAEFGEIRRFKLLPNKVSTNYSFANYIGYGYIANQSQPYMSMISTILLNNYVGNERITLYTYFNKIDISFLGVGNADLHWSALTSTNSLIDSGSPWESSSYLIDYTIEIPQTAFTQAYYIDISYGNKTVRFNVIKPLNASDTATRIYWRNEYGGISFFDFTGQKVETDPYENGIYEKSFYNYYTNAEENALENQRIYKIDTHKEIKLKSHLMEKNGRYIANSLKGSKLVWCVINGKKYYIRPVSIEVNEEDNYDNIYTMTLTYTYKSLT